MAPGPGTITLTPGPGARRAITAARRAPFKATSATASGTGPVTLTPKLTRSSRRTLRRKRRLRLSLAISFTPLEGGAPQAATAKVTLTRPKPPPKRCPKRAPATCAMQLALVKLTG
jgi:hypothetical protein